MVREPYNIEYNDIYYRYYKTPPGMIIVDIVYLLFIIILVISSIIPRLHDVGKKGYLIFIILVPLIEQIVILIFLWNDSQKEENDYGPNPKNTNKDVKDTSLNLEKTLSSLEWILLIYFYMNW